MIFFFVYAEQETSAVNKLISNGFLVFQVMPTSEQIDDVLYVVHPLVFARWVIDDFLVPELHSHPVDILIDFGFNLCSEL